MQEHNREHAAKPMLNVKETRDADRRKITKIRFYECGSCENNLALLMKGRRRERRTFPALAVLIEHRIFGNILYDTGYGEGIFQNGLVSRIYNLANPTRFTAEDSIVHKLEADGIAGDSVTRIILSHAHPDHIGGLNYFTGYELISTAPVLETMETPGVRDLVFRNMLPGVGKRTAVSKRAAPCVLERYFNPVYDILRDGSILGIRLDGHSRGQLGLFLPEFSLLLAADACWGRDLVSAVPDMRLPARLIQNDYTAYKNSLSKLCRLKREHPEIRILFSHQSVKERTYGGSVKDPILLSVLQKKTIPVKGCSGEMAGCKAEQAVSVCHGALPVLFGKKGTAPQRIPPDG